jgi:hypothetical protein
MVTKSHWAWCSPGVIPYATDVAATMPARDPAVATIEVQPTHLPDGRTRIDVDGLDLALSKLKPIPSQFQRPTVVDLSSSTYIAHDALLYLGAIARFRAIRRQATRIRLSQNARLFDFLRSWRFFEFIGHCTGNGVLNSVTIDSARYLLRQRSQPPRYVRVIQTPNNGYESLLHREQFEITPIDLKSDAWRAATILQEKWLEKHLISVLDILLGGEGKRVATHIVMEAVLNAASHPNATMAYLSSQISAKPEAPWEYPILELSIWDDGESVGETLARTRKRSGEITSPAFGQVKEVFNVELQRSTGRTERRILTSSESNLPSAFSYLNVAAFMLGVSSRPERRNLSDSRPPASEATEDPLPAAARDFGGIGLYLVRRTAIDLFGGQIHYATGDYRYKITAAEEANTYRVEVIYQGSTSWPLKGNLLRMVLPLRSRPTRGFK